MSRPTFNLQIYTPDRTFYTGEVESLVVPAVSGSLGILYNALPSVSVLKPGVIRFFQNNKWSEAICGDGGILSVRKGAATVLVESCRWPHEAEEDDAADMDSEDKKRGSRESLHLYKLLEAKLAVQFSKLKSGEKREK